MARTERPELAMSIVRLFKLIKGLCLAVGVTVAPSATALNDCLPGDFFDQRGLAEIEIGNDDPTNPFLYRPRCVTISEGTRVRFRATPNFGMHPLFGGLVSGGQAVIDPDSEIGVINSGKQAERILVAAGEHPYYCDFHYNQGMMGSILVVPQLFANGFDD